MAFVFFKQERQQALDVLILHQSRAIRCFIALLQKEAAVTDEKDDAESTAPLEPGRGVFLSG